MREHWSARREARVARREAGRNVQCPVLQMRRGFPALCPRTSARKEAGLARKEARFASKEAEFARKEARFAHGRGGKTRRQRFTECGGGFRAAGVEPGATRACSLPLLL